MAVGDLNKDGYDDIVAANKSNGGIQVWLNGGYETFYRMPGSTTTISDVWTSAESPVSNGNYNGVAILDFNKDGNLDVLAAHDFTGGTGAEVWLNTADSVPPTVGTVSPVDGATDISIDTEITATFSEDMDMLTLRNQDTDGSSSSSEESTITVHGSKTGFHSGTIFYDDTTFKLTFTLDTPFLSDEIVTVTLSAGITDLAGNYLDGNGDGTSAGNPSDNYSWTFTAVDTVAPLPPTGLAGTAGEGQAILSWTAPVKNENGSTLTDLTGFNIYRGTTSGGPYFQVNASLVGSTTTTYTDSPLINGTTYYYVVTAVDVNNNESVNSDQTSVTPALDTVAPSAPTSLAAVAGDGIVTLTWTEPTTNSDGSTLSDLDGYYIYRGTTSGSYGTGPINSTLIPKGTASYGDDTVTNGVIYYYVVTAVDSSSNANESANSGEVSATPVTDTDPPSAPSGLTATGGAGIIDLSWTAPTLNESGSAIADFASYNVYRYTASFSNVTTSGVIKAGTVTDINTTTWQDTVANGLLTGVDYYYRLTSVDTNGNESTSPSGEASAQASSQVNYITVTSSSYTIPADGTTTATITATVQQSNGNPADDGLTISFQTTDGTFSDSGTTSTTAATSGGTATATLVASNSRNDTGVTVTASYGSVQGTATIYFKPGPPATVTLSASDTSITADGSSTTTITANVKDSGGDAVKDGLLITFTTTNGTFSTGSTTSEAVSLSSGQASTTLTAPSSAGTADVSAVIGSATVTGVNVTFYTPNDLGDVDGNSIVDGSDLTALGLAFGSRPGDPAWNVYADFDGSDRIDGGDMAILGRYFGKGVTW